MGALPSRSNPSMASYMHGMKIQDKSEKGLMVRIGTLIDAVTNVQRGHANAASGLNRRSLAINGKRPPRVAAVTENVFNGAAVTIDPIQTAAGLSNYEIQIDSDPNFSNPTTKIAFNKNVIFKGLERGITYNLRARGLTKGGSAGPWTNLDPVVTTPSAGETTADFDGTLGDEGRISKDFNFVYHSEQLFCMTNFGLEWVAAGGFIDDSGEIEWTGDIANWTVILRDNYIATQAGTNLFSGTLTAPDLTEDTSGVTYADRFGEIIRYWPIMIFPLFDMPAFIQFIFDVSGNIISLPAVPYINNFSVSGQNSPRPVGSPTVPTLTNPTQDPVVWIKFGSLS